MYYTPFISKYIVFCCIFFFILILVLFFILIFRHLFLLRFVFRLYQNRRKRPLFRFLFRKNGPSHVCHTVPFNLLSHSIYCPISGLTPGWNRCCSLLHSAGSIQIAAIRRCTVCPHGSAVVKIVGLSVYGLVACHHSSPCSVGNRI